MHKNTKLTPTLRREVYQQWEKGQYSFRKLAINYHVDKNVISKVILRGRLGDFSVHDSKNHRFRSLEFGLKRLSYVENKLSIKLEKRNKRKRRYEKAIPGEMVHGDTKRLSPLYEIGKFRKVIAKAPVLFVSIDDHSRWLQADLLPDRTMWSSSMFLEVSALRAPFKTECHYSDNGGEYKGNSSHAFVATCLKFGIEQRFTKPKHPWTNGKAERVIQTILNEWYRPNKDRFQSMLEMKQSLYEYVDFYNHDRKHQGINNLTPFQRLAQFYANSGDNA
ncbi:IS481 family transposase [Candidatus Parcubacteria bacterium]|nr:MAG: IS481 family transposase [Candidatus Parcubacteria bacterium]